MLPVMLMLSVNRPLGACPLDPPMQPGTQVSNHFHFFNVRSIHIYWCLQNTYVIYQSVLEN